ncbi:MAG TPA: hypothetical protein VIK09_01315 [Candidatus Humimicrobiaceae bacterium]
MSEKDITTALDGLRNEIKSTLYFFLEFDLKMFKKVSSSTVQAFEKQGVKFPEIFKNLKQTEK